MPTATPTRYMNPCLPRIRLKNEPCPMASRRGAMVRSLLQDRSRIHAPRKSSDERDGVFAVLR
jgi:hypothetical protein